MFGLTALFGKTHDVQTDETYLQPYALADSTYLYQARCSCGWFSDVYLEEREFVEALRQTHADTGQ